MNNVRRKMMASTIVFGALNLTGFSANALAQTAPSEPGAMATQRQLDQTLPQSAAPTALTGGPESAAPAVAEVVVTGSLIRQPNLTSTSPQTTITNEEFKLQGATNVEDVLNSLPSVFASQSEGMSNGATGIASVDLRGLGDKRTLVLIDGKRVGTGDVGDNGAVDLNIIPSALIQRVDVVTGGESAIYGSDAISGVVNFIMQHNFQGVRLDGNFDDFEHGNGNSYLDGLQSAAGFTSPKGTWSGGRRVDVTAIVGVNSPDDKGNVTAYIGYRNIQAVTQDKLDYSACALAESGSGFACSGSGTTTSARFITSTGDSLYLDPKTSALRTYNGATDAYNYAPYNYYQRPDTRYTGGFFGHYDVSPKLDLYADFMFMDDNTTAQIAPSGLFGSSFTLPCSNPELSASELSQLCGGSTNGSFTSNILRRNVEGGPRDYILRHQEFREVIGARGDLDSVWHYDVYGEYSQSTVSSEFTGDISLSRAQAALSGCSASYSTTSALTGCVPYNIYTPGGVTSAATNYIESDAFEASTITQQVVNATISGDLGKYGLRSPLASDGVSVALGTEYRREALKFSVDQELSSGDLASAGMVEPVSGSYDIYELFGEVRVPLVSDRPFVKDLSIDGAYRFSDYSTVGTTSTYSADINYSPSRDIRFRASFARAERAPNITELFTAQTVGNGALNTDNCAGDTPVYTEQQCARTGVTAAEYGHIVANTASQYNGLYGGNPDLKPEVATTFSGGIVFTPRFIPNLSVTLDYFNIFVADVITTYSAQNALDDCATANDSFDCSLIHRSAIGSLWLGNTAYVTNTLVNAGSLQTSGADLQVDYRYALPQVYGQNLGKLSFDFLGTYLASIVTENEPGSGNKYDCAGFYGDTCGTPNPVWRHKFRVTWNTPWKFDVSGQWRYIGAVRSDGDIPSLGDTAYAADAKIPAVSYLDMTVSMKIKDRYTLRFGCKNVFDDAPPLVGIRTGVSTVYNGNTFPGVYDVLGRNVFAGLTADF